MQICYEFEKIQRQMSEWWESLYKTTYILQFSVLNLQFLKKKDKMTIHMKKYFKVYMIAFLNHTIVKHIKLCVLEYLQLFVTALCVNECWIQLLCYHSTYIYIFIVIYYFPCVKFTNAKYKLRIITFHMFSLRIKFIACNLDFISCNSDFFL